MAKKTKSTKKKSAKKPVARKPAARKRRVALGLPAKSASTVKAADAPEHPVPPVDQAKPDAAGGDSFTHVGDGVYEVTLRRRFTSEEAAAIVNAAGDVELNTDEIGERIVDFAHEALEDAIAEAEADAESEQPRYQDAPAESEAAGDQGSEPPLRKD